VRQIAPLCFFEHFCPDGVLDCISTTTNEGFDLRAVLQTRDGHTAVRTAAERNGGLQW